MKATLLLLLAVVGAATAVDYAGHLVVRVVPETADQVRHLGSLERFDFWIEPSAVGRFVDIRVGYFEYADLIKALDQVGLSHQILIDNVGRLIDEQMRQVSLRRAIHSGKEFDFFNYHRYDELVAFMTELTSTSALVSTSVIGTTVEGRDIISATVSTAAGAGKPLLYLECAMHAREWVTPATCIWMLDQLATQYGVDAEITLLVDTFDWMITPVSNPDGYEYTWDSDRLWRKNRQSQPGSICKGTDPNRNFGVGFGGPGTSSNPCLDTYRGPSAYSTAEATAMRDALAANRGRVKAAISIHSYSQYWMSPYAYKDDLPDDYPEMYRVMEIAVDALTATYGTRFTFGNIADVIYLAAGSSCDHAYDVEGVLHAYALELRDTGRYGFLLPASQIAPTATETFNGLKAMAQEILNTLA